jgi:hypothetical protein
VSKCNCFLCQAERLGQPETFAAASLTPDAPTPPETARESSESGDAPTGQLGGGKEFVEARKWLGALWPWDANGLCFMPPDWAEYVPDRPFDEIRDSIVWINDGKIADQCARARQKYLDRLGYTKITKPPEPAPLPTCKCGQELRLGNQLVRSGEPVCADCFSQWLILPSGGPMDQRISRAQAEAAKEQEPAAPHPWPSPVSTPGWDE